MLLLQRLYLGSQHVDFRFINFTAHLHLLHRLPLRFKCPAQPRLFALQLTCSLTELSSLLLQIIDLLVEDCDNLLLPRQLALQVFGSFLDGFVLGKVGVALMLKVSIQLLPSPEFLLHRFYLN